MNKLCEHNTVTSTFELGWHCCDCGERLLSLSLPIPLSLIEMAINGLVQPATKEQQQ